MGFAVSPPFSVLITSTAGFLFIGCVTFLLPNNQLHSFLRTSRVSVYFVIPFCFLISSALLPSLLYAHSFICLILCFLIQLHISFFMLFPPLPIVLRSFFLVQIPPPPTHNTFTASVSLWPHIDSKYNAEELDLFLPSDLKTSHGVCGVCVGGGGARRSSIVSRVTRRL